MRRSALLAALALAGSAQAASPPPLPKLNLQQEAALRCSAIFALVSGEQARNAPASVTLPKLDYRAREYFVVTTARLMDETGASRDTVTALARSRYAQVVFELVKARDPVAARRAILTPCLSLLDAEVAPQPRK
jgi:hypothetical protein